MSAASHDAPSGWAQRRVGPFARGDPRRPLRRCCGSRLRWHAGVCKACAVLQRGWSSGCLGDAKRNATSFGAAIILR
eukprot:2592069-Rhodomonas_salina.3